MKYLILGASGWIGHYLCIAAKKLDLDASVVGTHCQNPIYAPVRSVLVDYRSPDVLFNLIDKEKPDIIINAIAGIDELLYKFHVALITGISKTNIHYGFISSSMVFDTDLSRPHNETDAIGASSEYGKFKEQCERALTARGNLYTIFRFSATHGYSPNRISRTEKFLQRLSKNDEIDVDSGVFQNRLGVKDLTETMVAVMQKKATGVFHVGSTDQSDEVSFLRKVSVKFGYLPERIIEKPGVLKYLTTIPNAVLNLLGFGYNQVKMQTIEYIASLPEFQKYRL